MAENVFARMFSGIDAGVKDANDFAAMKQQVDLRKQQAQLRMQQFEEQKKQNKVATGMKFLDAIDKVQKFPTKVGRAFWKNFKGNFQEVAGVSFDPAFEEALFDPEMKGKITAFRQQTQDAITSGDIDFASETTEELFAALPHDQALEIVDKVFENVEARRTQATDIAAKERQTTFKEQQATTRQKEKLGFEQAKERRKLFKDLAGRAESVFKQFRGKESAFDKIAAMAKPGLFERNPQARVNIGRLSLQLTEERNSAALEGEFRMVETQETFFNRALHQASRFFGEKGSVPVPVAKQIAMAGVVLKGAIDTARKKALAPIVATMRSQGINSFQQAQEILGDDAILFRRELGLKVPAARLVDEKMNDFIFNQITTTGQGPTDDMLLKKRNELITAIRSMKARK